MSNVPDAMANLEILRAACCVAAQDGKISDDERPIIHRLADKAGVGDVALAAMIEKAEEDPEFNRQQFEIIQTDPGPTLRALAAVATADGAASGDQREVVTSFAKRLGIDEARVESVLASPEASG